MGNRVPRIKTSVSVSQMAQAISNAWMQLFGSVPSKEQVSLVLAQNSLETGNRNSMWNYNIGNLTTNGKGSYDFYDDLSTDEQIAPGKWKKMNLKYRAYSSLEEGAKDYLLFLKGKRYSDAWQHIINPDPIEFSKALKRAGYYTANEAPYTKSLTKLYGQFVNSNVHVEKQQMPTNNLDDVLNQYLQMITASQNRQAYKILPTNNIIIKIKSSELNNSIEFARILCAALSEELLAKAYTCSNGNQVEVECTIQGPEKECFDTVQQLSNSVGEAFAIATNKIGSIHVKLDYSMNKKSSYNQIDFKTAETQYRKFLLRFI